jgi:hypothetical protein
MNSVHLIGRLATDVDVKEVNGGSKVSSFILAVDRTAEEADFAILHTKARGSVLPSTGPSRLTNWDYSGVRHRVGGPPHQGITANLVVLHGSKSRGRSGGVTRSGTPCGFYSHSNVKVFATTVLCWVESALGMIQSGRGW